MKKTVLCLATALALAPTVGSAQVSIDMNRISCGEFVAMPADDGDATAAWISGWFNQKAGYTWIDLKAYHRNMDNIRKFCAANPKEMVMTAVYQAVQAATKNK
ncbi:hypothetical protein M2323_001124 [Rhodoblastus acidophilus]|uniref:HdeA/HdeB family chaperone n=1 Tax=Rhodoblastus acidophilus TaxID=1074 RepID=UPI00161FBEB7|nr:HdeA/HdeB family chaperone [Rhodoblastus acidophilus]MCW2283462.1 hypothetical protein [Rhodoblastus acidophilus]MCW2332214.1 hypothetical protein [Rhodoblastus acidophilus]